MAVNTAVPVYTAPLLASASFVNADGTAEKTLASTSSAGTRLDGIVINSNDTSDNSVAFFANDGSTDHYLGVVAVPAGSGYTTIARVNALATLSPGPYNAIVLPSTWLLKCAPINTVTSAKTLTVIASGGTY